MLQGLTLSGDSIALRKYRDQSLAAYVRATALLFLRGCYAQRAPGCLRYDDDESKTEIIIASGYNGYQESTETRPALIVTRGPIGWMNLQMTGGMISKDLWTNTTTYRDLARASFGVSALSTVELESELLASEAFDLIKGFRQVLQKLGFSSIRAGELSETRLIEEAGGAKLWITTASVVCQLDKVWELEPEAAAMLRKLVLEYVDLDNNSIVQSSVSRGG